MSLRKARLPSLEDKHAEAEALRDALEQKDGKLARIIKKASKKN
jgi:hypothetical protein